MNVSKIFKKAIILSGILLVLLISALFIFKNVIFADVAYPETKIFVAQNGDDKYSGKYPEVMADGSDGPVRTLSKAQQILRELKQSNPNRKFSIALKGGEHALTNTFRLTSQDSGISSLNSTIFESYPGETAVLSGAQTKSLNWQNCGQECKSSAVYKAYLPNQAKFNTLFINEKRAQKARTPNDTGSYEQRHYFFGEKAVDPVYKADGSLDILSPQCNSYLYYQQGQIDSGWRNLNDVEVVFRSLYLEYRDPIKSVDTQNKKVFFEPSAISPTIGKKYCYNNYFSSLGSRFYVENVFEALDSPGEYYFDNSAKWLYYYPRNDENLAQLDVRISAANSLVEIGSSFDLSDKPKNIQLKNIRFAYTDHNVPVSLIKDSKPAISVYNSENISIENSEIKNVAGAGIYVDAASKNIKIRNNEISNTGLDGIRISQKGEGSYPYNETEGVFIENNRIHDVAYDGSMMVHPISIMSAGYTKVANNTIYNAPYSGISKQQAVDTDRSDRYKIDLQYNEIYNVMQKLNDGGGVHLCTKFGTAAAIRNNYIHDINTTEWNIPSKNDISGIYYDCSGTPTNAESYNNLIKNVPLGITVINQGANKIFNNILVDVPGNAAQGPIHAGLCCYADAACAKDKTVYGFTQSPNEFYRNIFYYKTVTNDPANPTRPIYLNSDCSYGLQRDVLAKVIKQRDWNLYFDYSNVDTNHPSIYINNGGPKLRQWSWLENIWSANQVTNFENNSIFADPQFENVSQGDYRLKATSPAIGKLGFQPFSYMEAGAKGLVGAKNLNPSGSAQAVFDHGFSVFGSTANFDLSLFSQNNLVLYRYDSVTERWLIYPNGGLTQARPNEAYYVYNPGPSKTLNFGFGNPYIDSYQVTKGWNMLWTSLDKPFSALKLTYGGVNYQAQQLINENKIYRNIFIIDDTKATSTCRYFKLLDSIQGDASCDGANRILGRSSVIHGGRAFWVYVY